jgi:hypothetical protein
MGICGARDLSFCELPELQELGEFIKKVPQRRFFHVLGLNPDGSRAAEEGVEHEI